jgi:hypothetical protein
MNPFLIGWKHYLCSYFLDLRTTEGFVSEKAENGALKSGVLGSNLIEITGEEKVKTCKHYKCSIPNSKETPSAISITPPAIPLYSTLSLEFFKNIIITIIPKKIERIPNNTFFIASI